MFGHADDACPAAFTPDHWRRYPHQDWTDLTRPLHPAVIRPAPVTLTLTLTRDQAWRRVTRLAARRHP